MGGEGSMMTANVSLRNNRNLVSKRKEGSGLSGNYSNLEIAEFPVATPEQLKEIRERILKENKILRIKQFVIAGILIAAFLLFLLN